MNNKANKPAAPVIAMTPCKSSNISAHGYSAATQTLAIQFSSGHTYHYDKVSQDMADRLCQAKSVGSFFASEIRNGFTGVKQPAKATQPAAT